jgi:hypothetical protein
MPCPLQWLTFGPTTQVFIDDIKGNATNVMSAAQWHPAVTTTDPFFGPSASYTRDLYNWAQVNASGSCIIPMVMACTLWKGLAVTL